MLYKCLQSDYFEWVERSPSGWEEVHVPTVVFRQCGLSTYNVDHDNCETFSICTTLKNYSQCGPHYNLLVDVDQINFRSI